MKLRMLGIAFAALLPMVSVSLGLDLMRKYVPPPTMRRPPYRLGIYDGYKTPAWVLRGIAKTESRENDNAIGDDGVSIGRMQINERFRKDRIARFGWYDPRQPNDSIRVASCIIQENIYQKGTLEMAVEAYNRGPNHRPDKEFRYYNSVYLLGHGPLDGISGAQYSIDQR